MKFSRVTAAIVMASLSSPLLAAEQSVGKLTSASQGTFVSRDGKLTPAFAGQSLYKGDRVITRSNATAKVAMPGCSVNMKQTSMLSVSPSACAVAAKSFAQEEVGGAAAGGGTGAASAVIIAASIAAVGLGVYVAVDENDSAPTSP